MKLEGERPSHVVPTAMLFGWLPSAYEDSCNGEKGLGSNKIYLISYVVLFI